MVRSIRIVVRLFAVVAVLTAVGLLLEPLDEARGPYLSALSYLATPAMAQPGCNFTICGPGGLLCRSMNPPPNFNCAISSGGQCHDHPC